MGLGMEIWMPPFEDLSKRGC
uniref:Uncharacterized protein n=1 Tax=Arundo donax TaxID=35708 RepID=A0A0A9FFS1_ARUDO